MRPLTGLAAQAVLMPRSGIERLFTFGDSYTATSFNMFGPQPSLANPLGNPALGQGSPTDGPNWLGYDTAFYNTSLLMAYNMAFYGASIDNTIVPATSRDLSSQVEQDFRGHYCKNSQIDQDWDSETSLFIMWIGINDIHFSYDRKDIDDILARLFERHLQLAETLYNCGARRFLLINVPPVSRSPWFMEKPQRKRQIHETVVSDFNTRLKEQKEKFQRVFSNSSIKFYDSWSLFTQIFDNPTEYGFDHDTKCMGNGCLWWDNYHPSTSVHSLLALNLQEVIMSS